MELVVCRCMSEWDYPSVMSTLLKTFILYRSGNWKLKRIYSLLVSVQVCVPWENCMATNQSSLLTVDHQIFTLAWYFYKVTLQIIILCLIADSNKHRKTSSVYKIILVLLKCAKATYWHTVKSKHVQRQLEACF